VSDASSVDAFLSQAEEREKAYDWVGAAEFYQKALNQGPEADFLKLGQVQERIGYAFYRASMQVESREEFEERTRQAISAYRKAQGFYESLTDEEEKNGKTLRCGSCHSYLESWLTSNQPKVNKLLTDCLEMASKSLAIFSKSKDMLQYGITYDALSFFPLPAFFRRIFSERDRQVMKEDIEKGLQWGEKAREVFSEIGDKPRFASVYLNWITCFMIYEWFFIAEPEDIDRHNSELMRHLSKLLELSQEIGDTTIVGMSHFWMGDNTSGEESINHLKKAIEAAKKTRDKFMQATALDFMANRIYWKAIVEEIPDERRKLAEKAMKFYDKGQHLYSIVPWETPRGGLIGPPGGHAEHYYHLAQWEPDLAKKKELLDKANKTGIEALKKAEESYTPNVVSFTLHLLSRILEAQSGMKPDVSEKRDLLERAMEYEKRAIKANEWKPHVYWNVGTMYNFLADIKAELGYLERDPENRRKLLEEAASHKEQALKLIGKQEAPFFQLKGVRVPFVGLYGYQDNYGTLLNHLYELTGNTEHLKKSVEISRKALDSATKLGLVSLVAEAHWKIARAQDDLQEYSAAAENFECASEYYLKAATKIPQLKDVYQDHSSYMLAWSEIEKARHHHARQEYGLAKEHYEKAASLHNTLRKWAYLSSNYSAWAQVEQAEDLSRKEQSEQAMRGFEQAAKMFQDSKESLQTKLHEIEDQDEKHMVTGLIKAADLRHEYCVGRTAIEKAKILDKQGEHHTSSEKYRSAAEIFERIAQNVESEEVRKELKLIATLSKAWQKMILAEAEASPRLYVEAAQLFEEAKELNPNEKAKNLALGHSRFCKALEVGMNFADTRETTLHAAATQHLESAANYYVKADFQNASEYAKATGLLFDAYLQMDNAKKEVDPEKRAKLYIMAEKVLRTSASSFMKAEHQEKTDQVLKLLEKVQEERELAVSLTEVLHAPSIISSTKSFTTPAPTNEEAVGLERFEHADVQATVVVHPKELKVDENLDLEIELVNAGKGPAVLSKITEVVPKGFKLTEKPEIYRVEDSYLNMKGKRLNPLKTEEVRLVLKPKVKGIFALRPRISYLDENGNCKTLEPEPINITVRELGIVGWIKGER